MIANTINILPLPLDELTSYGIDIEKPITEAGPNKDDGYHLTFKGYPFHLHPSDKKYPWIEKALSLLDRASKEGDLKIDQFKRVALSLEEERERRLSKVKGTASSAMTAPLLSTVGRIPGDALSRQQLMSAVTAFTPESFPPNYYIFNVDGERVTVTYADLRAIISGFAARDWAVRQKLTDAVEKIEAATSIEAIRAIDPSFE